MLKGIGLSKVIEGQSILSGVTIGVTPGTISCLIGPSGGGKSSVLSCLSLLTHPTSGTIEVDGRKFPFGHGAETVAAFPYPKVTIVFQGLFLWPHLTNEENIRLPLRELGIPDTEFRSLVERLSVQNILSKYPHECSGGEKQRIALIRQILLKPTYLLLDEITSALDLETVNVVAEVILELKNVGIGILLVTHMLNLARRVSDDFYFLDQGKVVENGKIEQLEKPSSRRLAKFLQIYT